MMRRRIRRATLNKVAVKHSSTNIAVIGNGSNVTEFTIIETNAGDRSIDGSPSIIKVQANTASKVNVGDIIKYLNITLQSGVTTTGTTNNTNGWIEWALVFRNETQQSIPTTNLGVRTLMDIATAIFRGDCLMTGTFPVAAYLPNVQPIVIKLPKKAIKWNLGQELTLYAIFRDSEVTSVATNEVKIVQTSQFKVYS